MSPRDARMCVFLWAGLSYSVNCLDAELGRRSRSPADIKSLSLGVRGRFLAHPQGGRCCILLRPLFKRVLQRGACPGFCFSVLGITRPCCRPRCVVATGTERVVRATGTLRREPVAPLPGGLIDHARRLPYLHVDHSPRRPEARCARADSACQTLRPRHSRSSSPGSSAVRLIAIEARTRGSSCRQLLVQD